MLARRIPRGGSGGFTVPVVQTRVAAYNGSGDNGVTYAIGVATYNGTTWTEYASNPVLTKGAGGSWESAGVKDPRLVWDGTQYVMFYSGYDGATVFQIGRATSSTLTGSWTKYASNPVIAVGAAGSSDAADIVAPVVYYHPAAVSGHAWWMWYAGISAAAVTAVHLAHSDDGITWTKTGAISGLSDMGPGAIYNDSGTFNLFTNHSSGVRRYTAPAPDGTYTASASNPLIQPRSATANVSPALTANAAAGANSVTVGSGTAAGLETGEPVIIADTNSGPEVLHVLSKTATSVTFTTNLVSAYQTADGATLRSLGYTARDCRSVIPVSSGGFEMFGSPFRALDGLTTPSPTVWEGTIRYTAAALDGPWTQDYARGLLFPLVNDASWSGTSAENPSVIVTP